jgi:CBS domain containing-hemolysin-like protein
MAMQESGENLTSEERLMIGRVLDLSNLTVRQLASPVTGIPSAEMNTTVGALLEMFRNDQRPHAFIAIWNREHHRIAGIVTLKTILYLTAEFQNRPASDFLKPILFLRFDQSVEEALRRMQKSGQRFAVILNAERREEGILTIYDVLRAVFGEVRL